MHCDRDVLLESINREIILGRSFGPFLEPQLPEIVTSSLGVREKNGGTGIPVIVDLSRSTEESVSDFLVRCP